MDDQMKVKIEMVGPALDIALIRVEGLVDTDTSRLLSKALEDVIANKHFKVVMDLENVDYISSAGWGIFIGELRELRRNDGDLKLAAMESEVEDVFKLLEFYNVLKTYTTVAEAVEDF